MKLVQLTEARLAVHGVIRQQYTICDPQNFKYPRIKDQHYPNAVTITWANEPVLIFETANEAQQELRDIRKIMDDAVSYMIDQDWNKKHIDRSIKKRDATKYFKVAEIVTRFIR